MGFNAYMNVKQLHVLKDMKASLNFRNYETHSADSHAKWQRKIPSSSRDRMSC